MSPHRVVAIDGPAASGKSSVARELALRLGFAYINSGAMYRAATWYVLENGVTPDDAEQIAQLIESAPIVCDLEQNESRIRFGEVDPANFLRDDSVVMEGRDIGSVVFPDTPYKFYIDASPEIRRQRRAAQGQRDQIAARDRADSSRRASPLIIAEDAHVIDSSNLTIDGVVGEIIGQLKKKGMKIA